MKLSMWRGVSVAFLLVTVSHIGFAQSKCTLTGATTQNWANPGPACAEGGDASSKTILIVPAGFTLNLDGADTWTGTGIVIDGIVNVNQDVTFNCSILVRNGGHLNLNAKLFLGSGAGCGYGIGVINGGTVDVGGTGSDRLTVCGQDMMKGNGSCNDCGGTNSGTCAYNGNPYCEPAAGFTGPTGYGEGGYSSTIGPTLTTTLPIRLAYFTAENNEDWVFVKWATDKEENFDHFELERASSNLNFFKITDVASAGYNTNTRKEYSWMDSNPFVGENYYRLKAVDLDGSFEYFKIASASSSANRSFSIYPNPANGNSVNYTINFDYSGNDRILVMDNMGNLLQQAPVSSTKGKLGFTETMKSGLYFVKYISNDFTQTVRVMVR